MKNLIGILFFLSLIIFEFVEAGEKTHLVVLPKLWDKTFGGEKDDEANSIIETKDGYIIAGYTESFGKGGSDVWIIKVFY